MKRTFRYIWRVIAITFLTFLALIVGGLIITALNLPMPTISDEMGYITFSIIISGIVISIMLGFTISKMSLSKYKTFIALFVLLFLNYITQILEALYFVPGMVTWSVVPTLLVQQSIMALFISGGVSILYSAEKIDSMQPRFPKRNIIGWGWRIILSASIYVLMYFIFGMINAAIFTEEYYVLQISGLNMPSIEVIFVLQIVRAIFIVFSVLPFVMNLSLPKKQIMITTGMILFVLGGLLPMFQQLITFPLVLVVSSTVEMFFQFFLTGMAITFFVYYEKKSQELQAS